jgi:predicted nucleotidyltransferase
MAVSTNMMPSKTPKPGQCGSLADALFTLTQQRVLGALFGQPDRSFFVTQIMELAGSGRGAVQRELGRLLQGGLVTVQMIGTQKHFQANPDSPLFDELCGIIQKTVGLAGPIREALESLANSPKLAFIYGSVAKRTDTSSSDIDLLVVSDTAELEEVYAVLMPVENALARQISLTLYTDIEFQKRLEDNNPFIKRVLSGPSISLIGSIDGE